MVLNLTACARRSDAPERDYSAAADAELAEFLKIVMTYAPIAPGWVKAEASRWIVALGGTL